jgi:rhodanese-related sulfurtransferase
LDGAWPSRLEESRAPGIGSINTAPTHINTRHPPRAGKLMREGWVLLDVRPPNETAKVSIAGAVEVPLFVPETRSDPASLLKRFSTWSTGGWWLGGTHMIPNPTFMQEVTARIPRDADVIVGCQRGLRSLAACEQLSHGGYRSLAWVNGGFDAAFVGDLPTLPDDKDLRWGGFVGFLGGLGRPGTAARDGRRLTAPRSLPSTSPSPPPPHAPGLPGSAA